MHKKKLTYFIHFIILQFIYSQIGAQSYIGYYNNLHESIYNYYHSNFKKADSLFNAALNLAEPRGNDLRYGAVLKAMLGKKEECIQLVKWSLIAKRPIFAVNIYADSSSLLRTLNRSELDNIVYSAIEFDSVKTFQFNQPYYTSVRNQFNNLLMKWNTEDDFILQNKNESTTYNFNNSYQLEFIDLIKKFGWPNFVDERITKFLYHLSLNNFEILEPILLNEVNKGNIDPWWYASMVDHAFEYFNLGESKYGTLVNYNADLTKFKAARKTIGLSPYTQGPYRTYKNCYHLLTN
jgi:hypothetical protein